MNKTPVTVSYIFFIIGILLIPTTYAQATKIGFVDLVVLLDQAPQTKVAKEKVEREFRSRDNELVGKQKKLRTQEDQLRRDANTLSAVARQKLEENISRSRREIKRDLDDFREDFALARNREMSILQKRVNEAIVKLAKDEQFDLIVGDSIIYASQGINITEKILQILRKQFKQKAGQ